MVKQLSFSHLRLMAIGTSYCWRMSVKEIVTRLNKHSDICAVSAILNTLFWNHIRNAEMSTLIKLSSVLNIKLKCRLWHIGFVDVIIMWCTRSLLLQVFATIDAFVFCKIYCMQVIPRQKRITAVGLKFLRARNLNLSVKMLFCELRKWHA